MISAIGRLRTTVSEYCSSCSGTGRFLFVFPFGLCFFFVFFFSSRGRSGEFLLLATLFTSLDSQDNSQEGMFQFKKKNCYITWLLQIALQNNTDNEKWKMQYNGLSITLQLPVLFIHILSLYIEMHMTYNIQKCTVYNM